MNPSEVSEQVELRPAEGVRPELSLLAEASPAAAVLNPSSTSSLPHPAPHSFPWLRLGYALEFLLALVAIVTMWSEIGGEGHLDLMPWYTKLGCILGLAWCSVRFTASLVEQPRVWTARTLRWLGGIVLFCLLMGGITYYYHLHEEPDDDQDDDTTAAAVKINNLGILSHHADNRAWPAFPIRCVARSAVLARRRVPVGSDGGDSSLRV